MQRYNTVNVDFLFHNVPSKGTDSYKNLRQSLNNICHDIRQYVDMHPEGPYYMKNRVYDMRFLERYLTQFDDLLRNGVDECAFSEETRVSDIDFKLYQDMSRYCKDVGLDVVISKFGPHVKCCNDNLRPEYYNKISLCYQEGQCGSQVIQHVDEDGVSYEDDLSFTFTDDDCKKSMKGIREGVQSELDERIVEIQTKQVDNTKENEHGDKSNEDSFDFGI